MPTSSDSTRVRPPSQHLPLGFEALRSSGLLWLINTSVLHPRGYALALLYPDGAKPGDIKAHKVEPVAWTLQGNGSDRWQFGCDDETVSTCDDLFTAVNALLSWNPEPGDD